nr:uncharacterized mitochondrial protein AtMg00810-like [Tanacetum cinerariifolium]
MLKKYSLEDSKSIKTPMSFETKLTRDKDEESVDDTKYHGMIGSLLYLTASWPDIMFSVRLCSRFQEAPKISHPEAVKRIFRYIKGKTHLGLWYPKGMGIETIVYADSDHTGDYVNHKSTSVNPPIYISCIEKFWNTASVKRSGDVTRLQAQVDKKKIVISEEIFAGLAQMGYEKPSTKLTFYKAFFSSQWKFLIHTILQSLSAKRTSWNEFSTAMASAVICLTKGQRFNFLKYIFDSLVCNVDNSSKFYMYPRFIQMIIQNQVKDLSTHTTRFISPSLTQKVFVNMKRVGKGFLGVETPLFEGMLDVRQPVEEGVAEAQVQIDDAVAAAIEENVAEDRVENLENDNAAQKLVIIKLKARVKRLEKANMVKSSKLRRLKKIKASKQVESSADMEDVFDQGRMIDDMDKDEGIELVKDAEVVTTAKLITKVVTVAASQIIAASATIPTASATIPAAAITVVAAYTRRRKGVIIRNPEEELPLKTPAVSPKVKDKGK